MLDENERERIRLEEVYRLEVQKSLKEKTDGKGVPKKLWTFINSSFGLWVLSAIFITWLGNAYTQRQNAKAEELKKAELTRSEELKSKEMAERLDLEIAYRLSQIQLQLYYVEKSQSDPSLRKNDVISILNSVSQPPGKDNSALYSEHSNLSLLAVAADLRRHIQESEHQAFDNILADLSGLRVLMEVKGVNLSDAKRVAGVMVEAIISRRWANYGFYFLDCTASSPFC